MSLKNSLISGELIKKLTAGLLVFLFIFPPPLVSLAQETESNATEMQNEITTQLETPPPDEEPPVSEPPTTAEEPVTPPEEQQSDTEEEVEEPEGEMSLLSDVSESDRDDSADIVKSLRIEPYSLTGSLNFEFPIAVPPGRNNMTPDIKLVYTSQPSENANIYGYGWSDNIPYIERINRKGVNKLYTENFFYSSLDGEIQVNTGTTYGAKIDNGNFLKYEYVTSNKWLVTDKLGTTYKFGYSTSTQIYDTASTTRIFRWMLEEVRDTNDNYIKYEYVHDGNQMYPYRIIYTGNGSTDGILEVIFSKEVRTDKATTTRQAFEVASNYRINEIQTKVNDTWVKKYAIAYTTGSNGRRALISSITESGQDESSNVVTLPPTIFQYQSATKGWTSGGMGGPSAFVNSTGGDWGTRVLDVDGDGVNDVMTSGPNSTTTQNLTWIRTSSGWQVETPWAQPDSVLIIDSSYRDSGIRLADINGDSLIDVLYAQNTGSTKRTWINNGNGWTQDLSGNWLSPEYFSDVGSGDFAVRLVDVNGDGLTDVLRSYTNDSFATSSNSYLNNGNGWTAVADWQSPKPFLKSGKDYGTRFADVNGDGLIDVIHAADWAEGDFHDVYINNGKTGWTLDQSWGYPATALNFTSSGEDRGVRLYDVNGDGLPDLTINSGSSPTHNYQTHINNGTRWDRDAGWDPPNFTYTFDGGKDNGARIFDVNLDGMDDIVQSRDGASNTSYTNNSKRVDLLTAIGHSQGATSTITYKNSASYVSGGTLLNPDLPQNYDTVQKVEVYDGISTTTVNTYVYEGGDYFWSNTFDRRLAGFHKITKADSASTTIKTFYHQGNTTDSSNGESLDSWAKIGKPYRMEVADVSGNMYTKTINTWATSTLSNNREFVKLTKTTELTYDGDSDHKDKSEEYVYDNSNGNITQKTTWGEVNANNDGTFTDIGTDNFETTIDYAASSTGYLAGLPSHETTVDYDNTKLKETKYYYDLQSLGVAVKGNLTKEERWKSGTSFIDYEKTYNSYGLVTQDKDPRDKATNYTFDTYNLYVSTSTNPLSQTTVFKYDYSLGKPKEIKNTNGRIFQTTYDGVDRVIEEKVPDQTTPTTLVTRSAYTYTDNVMPRIVQQSNYLNSATSTDIYTYLDGLVRPIQERRESGTANTYAVRDFSYNSLGLKQKESLPYFSSGTSRTTATSTNELFINYLYDPQKRVTKITNAVGSTTSAYDDWKVTVNDPNSEIKILYNDAYDNLSRVDEKFSTTTYTTTYIYDIYGNPTQINDAEGNIRYVIYDGLGRRTSISDLHDSNDSSYTVTDFTYDDAGNITNKNDGRSVNYTHDDINRVTTEDFTGAAGVEIGYKYDTCTEGVGQLCTATSSGLTINRTYTAVGNLRGDTRVLTGLGTYLTITLYDRQGNITSIDYPDGSQVQYRYNDAGQIIRIIQKPSGGLFSDVIRSITYSPTGMPTTIVFGNWATTTNTYNQNALYRLTNKVTTLPGTTTKPQNIAYTYDPVGNITKIIDTSNTVAAKTMDYIYDDLHRLTSASSTLAASGSNYLETYLYSAIGNILTKNSSTYYYTGDQGSLKANPHAPTVVGGTNLTYDTYGNVTAYGSASYVYDYRDRMGTSTTATSTTYTYDFENNRVKVTRAGDGTDIYPNKYYSELATTSPDRTQVRHIFAGNTPVATIDTQYIPVPEPSPSGLPTPVTKKHYIHTDHLDGTNVVTSQTATVEQVSDYYPYGSIRTDQRTTYYNEEREKYAGSEQDTETGLNYMQARYQNPTTGVFQSQDPVFKAFGDRNKVKEVTGKDQAEILADPQGLHSYSYARGNPITMKDENGNYFETAFDAVMFSLSVNDFKRNPNLWTGFGVVADGLSLVTSIPAVIGAIRHGDDAAKMIKNGVEVVKNIKNSDKAVERGIKSVNSLPDETLVCRGGACSAMDFITGTGVKTGKDGTLSGISVLVGVNGENRLQLLEKLSPKYNGQAGFTTLGEIRNTQATIQQSGKNLLHFNMGNLSPQGFVELFNKTK